jgi:hypothetical protein
MRDHLFARLEDVYVEHLWPREIDKLNKAMDTAKAIVVPMRHPIRVAESWKSRSKLESPGTWENLEGFWSRLFEHVVPREGVYYLPLDLSLEARHSWLQRINAGLQMSITTTWPIVSDGTAALFALTLDQKEKQRAQCIVDAERPFFAQFGYD